MPNYEAEVEADLAAALRLGASRVAVTTEKAIAALHLLEEAVIRNAEHVLAHAKSFEELAKQDLAEVIKNGREALTDHLVALRAAEHKFWEAFHGQPVRGVEIVWARDSAPPSQPTEEVKT
ncbi:MAG: hypothetical protein ACP5P4_08135 [Steroidobacteraceae bacterium]